jgi:predicted acyltransferase
MRRRFLALDVFRGATVALMILVNNPGSWDHLYPPLAHAAWHGCTPTDLVFPFFLFAVGNAMAFTLPGLVAGPAPAFWARVAQRTALIFAIGLFLNASPFVRWSAAGELVPRSLETLRLMGVLQRIALAWGVATVVVWAFGRRGAAWGAAVLLLGYWAACLALAQGSDPYSLEGFFGTALDRALLGAGHLYRGEGVPFDPEGLASTLPAVAQVLLGYLAGDAVARARVDEALVNRLFVAACGALVLAAAWQLAMPFNKKIWTSSYVLLTTGLALALLALLIRALELQRRRGAWVDFCEVFGKNALFVFALSGFVPRVWALVKGPSPAVPAADGGWAVFGDPRLGSLLVALAHVGAYWLVARWLDRRRLYIRV